MFRRRKIGELIKDKKAHSQTGPFGTQLKASDYVEEGIPVINVRNIGFGEVRPSQLEFVDHEMANRLKSHKLEKNDIVFGRKGAVERHSLISSKEEGWLQGSDCIRLRILSSDFNPVFISYFFRTEYHKQWMINHGSFGATMRTLNQEIISQIEIPDIPIHKQNQIASMLSAFDNLIRNNNERIGLLEEMAEEIYKEWFVRLRFPNYERYKFFNKEGEEVPFGTFGALPDRWCIIILKEISSIEKGPSLNYEIPINEGVPVINQSCVRNGILELQKILYTEQVESNKAHCFLQELDILINSMGDGTLGRVSRNVHLPSNKYIIHNCITFLRSTEDYSQYLLYYIVSAHQSYFVSIAQGSTGQSTLKKELIGAIKVMCPDHEVIFKFNDTISPMWQEVAALLEKNNLIQEIRDLLLPKLLSGKLSAEHLVEGEKFFNEDERDLKLAAEPVIEYQNSY